ncbi:unnamed protein product [Linum tenue]|uniref:Uncharacterized protein n=1 Tax=Linum tenue TaxID=586396 RepID=A0AAV0P2D6_9ROSI|nr:unnamed protein product [Linum tenue]
MVEVCMCGPSSVGAPKAALMTQLCPKKEGLREPRVSTKAKGRPPRRENARDPSWHENAAERQGEGAQGGRQKPQMIQVIIE